MQESKYVSSSAKQGQCEPAADAEGALKAAAGSLSMCMADESSGSLDQSGWNRGYVYSSL